jgi:hypothetical protein
MEAAKTYRVEWTDKESPRAYETTDAADAFRAFNELVGQSGLSVPTIRRLGGLTKQYVQVSPPPAVAEGK